MSDPDTQWSFPHLYNLPIVLKKFFYEQFIDRQEQKKKAHEDAKNNKGK